MDTHRAQVNPSPSGSSCLAPQLICSYILRPVAFLMGVAWEDCPVVAELLGMKLFLNEFVAYQGLSEYKQRRLAGTEEWVGSKKHWISVSVPLPLLGQGMMQLSLCRLAESTKENRNIPGAQVHQTSPQCVPKLTETTPEP